MAEGGRNARNLCAAAFIERSAGYRVLRSGADGPLKDQSIDCDKGREEPSITCFPDDYNNKPDAKNSGFRRPE